MVSNISPVSFRALVVGFLVMVTSLPGLANGIADLKAFRWQNRLILVFADADEVKHLQARLLAAEAGIIDRDIVWFIFSDGAVVSNYDGAVDDRLGTVAAGRWPGNPEADLQVVLIGKDGGNKMALNELDLDGIFITIDGMPMRRFEMRQKDAANGNR